MFEYSRFGSIVSVGVEVVIILTRLVVVEREVGSPLLVASGSSFRWRTERSGSLGFTASKKGGHKSRAARIDETRRGRRKPEERYTKNLRSYEGVPRIDQV